MTLDTPNRTENPANRSTTHPQGFISTQVIFGVSPVLIFLILVTAVLLVAADVAAAFVLCSTLAGVLLLAPVLSLSGAAALVTWGAGAVTYGMIRATGRLLMADFSDVDLDFSFGSFSGSSRGVSRGSSRGTTPRRDGATSPVGLMGLAVLAADAAAADNGGGGGGGGGGDGSGGGGNGGGGAGGVGGSSASTLASPPAEEESAAVEAPKEQEKAERKNGVD